MANKPIGDQEGYQSRPGDPVGESLSGVFHGSPFAGLGELLPGGVGGFFNHAASHPGRVYGTDDEHHAWAQAEMAGSKALNRQHLNRQEFSHEVSPTVYETTLTGGVDTDPEYDRIQGSAGTLSYRGERGRVDREIPMPPGSQGTLIPDHFGRELKFSVGQTAAETPEGRKRMTGARYERVDTGPREHRRYEPDAITAGSLRRQRADQIDRRHHDRVVAEHQKVGIRSITPADIKDSLRHEQRNPRLFSLSDVVGDDREWPYGVPAGYDDRVEAFRKAAAETPMPW